MNLVLFGAYNLSGLKCLTTSPDKERDINATVKRSQNSQYNGSVVTNVIVNEKPIQVLGTLRATDTVGLTDVLKEFDQYIRKTDRYFKISKDWLNIIQPTSDANFILASDAENKYIDTSIFQYGSGSLNFDINTALSANDYAEVYVTNNPTIDINSKIPRGCLEFWMYIPDKTYITSIDLTVGSDTSNYVVGNITTQYDGNAIENGWNYFSIAIDDMVLTGNIDFYAFAKYVRFKLNYLTAQANMLGVKIGGLIWQHDEDTRNYKGFFEDITRDNKSFNISFTKFSANLICYSGLGVATDDTTVVNVTGLTTTPVTYTVDFDGSYDPEPVITLTLNSFSNLDKIGITNLSTGETVEVDEAWIVKDVIVFDMSRKLVTRNNTQINFASTLPRFRLGKNSLYIYFTSTGEVSLSYTTQNINLAGTV